MPLTQLVSSLSAEPASIIYIATGAAGICLARLRGHKKVEKSSVAMLFCRRSSRETMAEINLLGMCPPGA